MPTPDIIIHIKKGKWRIPRVCVRCNGMTYAGYYDASEWRVLCEKCYHSLPKQNPRKET